MRSLASELRGRRVSLTVRSARELYKVCALLRRLGLLDLVEIAACGVEVPEPILTSESPEIVFACWLAAQLHGSSSLVVLGVDPGERNVGIAAVVGGIVAYTGLLRSPKSVHSIAREISKLGYGLRIRLGYVEEAPLNVRRLAAELKSMGFRVELVPERDARAVVLGDFFALGKLSQHEFDALRIALSPFAVPV